MFDAGATETGRPYFVMELVRGIKITDFCDENNLSTEARLKLFTQVCQAIQHAHQKGIIHRDIKPSNILVTQNEKEPVPKVIDFGIAKATTDQRLTDKTVFTAFEQFIGTPAYMSPEQAMMTSLDIDTRTDIYALGVLLYELLTGQTPFDANELMAAGLDAMRRTIREQEPDRPSTKLSQTLVAADVSPLQSPGGKPVTEEEVRAFSRRLLRLKETIPLLRGDLDWIVMKAIEKDRTRRYETANGLAMDIQRHLSNEPVTARPPSRWYEFQKTFRRHKFGFAAATALILVLGLGVMASSWQALRAMRAEREQIKLRLEAEAEKHNAQTEAAKSEQVARFLEDMLNGVGPSVARGRDTAMLKEILDNTATRVSVDLAGQPEVEADLRTTIGQVYHELGDFKKAESMHREALAIRRKLLGEEHLEVARSLTSLGQVLYRERRMAEAQAVHREALAMRVKLLGREHLDVASSLGWVANMLRIEGALPEAEAMHRQALALRQKLLGHEHVDVAHSLKSLAMDLVSQGKLAEGEQLHREALAMRRKLLGNDQLDVADSIGNVAGLLADQGELSEAETWYREAIAIRRKFDPKHPDLARTLAPLASLLDREEKLAESEGLYREAVDILRDRLAGDHPDFVEYSKGFSMVLWRQGKLGETEAFLRESISQFEKVPSQSASARQGRARGWSHNRLGILLGNTGREAEAQIHLQKAGQLHQAYPPEQWIEQAKTAAAAQPENVRRYDILGDAHLSAGEWQEAIDAYNVQDRKGGNAWQWFPLAIAHRQIGHHEEARAWFDKALHWMDSRQETRLRRAQAEAAVTLGLPDPWGRSQRASNQIKQGDTLQNQGLVAQARAAYADAAEIYRTLAADFPNVGAYSNRLSKLAKSIEAPPDRP